MKVLKSTVSIFLILSMLLAFSACGKKEEVERPMLEIKTPAETTAETENDFFLKPPTEPANTFSPVTLCDNEYCTMVQTSPIYDDGQYVDILVTNKTDGILTCEFGDQRYINDLRIVGLVYGGDELLPGETSTIRVDLNYYTEEQVQKIDISASIIYDNTLTGVYAQRVEAFNGLVTIYESEDPVPEKYVKTEKEIAVIDNANFKIAAVKYDVDYMTDDYWMQIYFENNSSDYLSFYFIDKVTMTSNLQEGAYELEYKGTYAITTAPQNCYTIEPGTGCYLNLNFKQSKINNYAIDINEVITIHFPVRVAAGWGEPLNDIDIGKVEADTYTLTFTRDQLVN